MIHGIAWNAKGIAASRGRRRGHVALRSLEPRSVCFIARRVEAGAFGAELACACKRSLPLARSVREVLWREFDERALVGSQGFGPKVGHRLAAEEGAEDRKGPSEYCGSSLASWNIDLPRIRRTSQ